MTSWDGAVHGKHPETGQIPRPDLEPEIVIPDPQFVIPDSQFVIPDSQFVIPDSQFVIPDSQFVIPDLIRDPVPRCDWIAGRGPQ
jgi:hypothetical protein